MSHKWSEWMDVSVDTIHFPLAGYVVHNQRFSYGVASYNQVEDGWKPTTWYSWSLIVHYLVHIYTEFIVLHFLLGNFHDLAVLTDRTRPSNSDNSKQWYQSQLPGKHGFSIAASINSPPKLLLLQYIYWNFWFRKMIKKVHHHRSMKPPA